MMTTYNLSQVKDQLIGLPESPERTKYELDLLTWQLKHRKRKPSTINMGITNKEGLQLMSSTVIRPEEINTQEFPDMDILAVKITIDMNTDFVLQELQKSFGKDAVKHPSKRGFVILNWKSHYNKTFV